MGKKSILISNFINLFFEKVGQFLHTVKLLFLEAFQCWAVGCVSLSMFSFFYSCPLLCWFEHKN